MDDTLPGPAGAEPGSGLGSPKALARLAGYLYLVIFIGAGFAQGFVRADVFVAGDPVATATNIAASESLFRAALAADLVAFLADAAIAVLFYVLLRPVSRTLSLMAAVFRLIGHPAIASVNLVNHFAALQVLRGGVNEGTADLAYTFMQAHGVGYLIGGAFFGIHLFLLGYLLIRSDLFPRIVGWLIGLAAAGYVIESFGSIFLPAGASFFAGLVAVTAVIGELTLCLWCIFKGVRATN